jgi:hypothetical protein
LPYNEIRLFSFNSLSHNTLTFSQVEIYRETPSTYLYIYVKSLHNPLSHNDIASPLFTNSTAQMLIQNFNSLSHNTLQFSFPIRGVYNKKVKIAIRLWEKRGVYFYIIYIYKKYIIYTLLPPPLALKTCIISHCRTTT